MKIAWQPVLSVLSIGLCILAIANFRDQQASRKELETELSSTSLAEWRLDLPAEIQAESDLSWARTWMARAVIADVLNTSELPKLAPSDRQLKIARDLDSLREMRQIAETEWLQHPARWQAALSFGAATYLLWSRSGDPRLTAERSGWERPLLAADQLGVGEPEPARFLAVGYLGAWSTLSTEERARSMKILKKAFGDPDTFKLLVERWLRVAPSWKIAVSLVPENSTAWAKLAQIFKQRQDTQRFEQAEAKRQELLELENSSSASKES